MTVHKLTAGDGYTYLSRQVAAYDTTEPASGGLESYYSEKGETPGRWMGRGLAGLSDLLLGTAVSEPQMLALFGQGRHPNAAGVAQAAAAAGLDQMEIDRASRLGTPYRVFDAANEFRRRCAIAFREHNAAQGLPSGTAVSPDIRARIRTELAIDMFVEEFGRAPANPRELSGHLARISRQATTAVAGYDLTFSPVKSVSTLWAIAPRDIALVIEEAHADAVTDVLTWFEDTATFTRTGHNGVAQVDVGGLLAAAFTHRESRAGDPDLHTHVAISNKVQTLDGRWLALDGRPVHKNVVAASERYNTRVEALLVDRLGVRFADRPDADPAKRPVREIVGIDGPLPRRWSSRRAAIDRRRSVLATSFQLEHGRAATAKEAIALAQQANLETREAKHAPRSHAEQRETWRAEALAVLGGENQLRQYVAGALTSRTPPPVVDVTEGWLQEAARAVVERLQTTRATWQEAHVRAEAERRIRAAGVRLASIDDAVDSLVRAALSPLFSLRLGTVETSEEPTALRRVDGSSVFDVVGSAVYTSAAVLAAERSVLDAAGRRDGHVTPSGAVDAALLRAAAEGVHLNPGQGQLVRDLATSGARVQVALAPAGTGKTTALRALAAAWRQGGGTVIGLAPSAAASSVLRDQINAPTDTLAKLVHASATGIDVPDWLPTIGPRTLLVVDEAGAAGTTDLAAVVDFATAAGASVRLVGDDQQLGAIGAGGLLRDLADTYGAARLTQVVRFVHPGTGAPNRAEGAASLALREGDPAALAHYADHDRLHVGDLATCTDAAYAAWADDRASGRDSLMLAPTRELVHQLNERARTERLVGTTVRGREVALADSSSASTGDVVITRRNQRTLTVGPTSWVKNGDRWTVLAAHPSGALDVVGVGSGLHVTLPPLYVRDNVTLGYASTVHGAQGVTVDRSHTIATGTESRQLLYVALTRGRHENHVYLATVGDGDPHTVITRDALLPPTAVDVLTRVLSRDDSPTSATTTTMRLRDPGPRLHADADRYVHALSTAAHERVGTAGLADIDATAEAARPGLTDADAYPALRARLALLSMAGTQPSDALRAAVADPRGLDDARDAAAVLDWRLDAPEESGPLPWLPAVPEALEHDAEWAFYLARRADQVATLATAVAAAASAWSPSTAPPWARQLMADPDLVGDLSVWRSALGIDGDRRPTGPKLPSIAAARVQQQLDDRVAEVLGHPGSDTARWSELVQCVDSALTTDPFWPVLAERLTEAARAGVDISTLVGEVSGRPLPDEQPAAALWWRLTDHLSPAVASLSGSLDRPLQPVWAPELAALLGSRDSTELMGHPSWTGLVAAVDEGARLGWQPAQLLGAAIDLLRSAYPDTHPPAGHDLATALLRRIGLLTCPADRGASGDVDWMEGLSEPDPTEPAPEHHGDVGIPTLRHRLLELNEQAAGFFAETYQGSWAQRYLTDRLGTDVIGRTVGLAPAGWTGLVDHLRMLGAEDDEMVTAGLATRATSGRVIDRFRDRVVFAIHGDQGILGWIGRRHPDRDGDEAHAGPKYLNTPETELFVKGDELFGLKETRALLAGGATPVLVEGPLDALAVTIAGKGQYVGISPLGTAFTDCQADKLHQAMGAGRPVVVAMDADAAGREASERIFWRLVDRGIDPTSPDLPLGSDPADLLRNSGPNALRKTLSSAPDLAIRVIDARIDAYADQLDTAEGQVHATRRAAQVIAALPRTSWPAHLTHVVVRTGIAVDIALTETLDAADDRDDSSATKLSPTDGGMGRRTHIPPPLRHPARGQAAPSPAR